VDHANWDEFVPHLADSFRVVTYDRRGHSRSERLARQSRMTDDVDDLAELLTVLDLSPAHVIGNSYGGMVALRLAVKHPDLCASVTAHEPPFLHLNQKILDDPEVAAVDRLQRDTVARLEAGDLDAGISQFVNAVVHPETWVNAPEEFREFLRSNAPSFIDDVHDPEPWSIDLDALGRLSIPVLLTQGDLSPTFYGRIIDEIASRATNVARDTINDAGHDPHVWEAAQYAQILQTILHEA
jgi:pimeloyl-ACP methyl ester carboxylesterase